LKKLVAIFLIALFLFNLVGYQFVFTYVQQNSDEQFEASIDNDDYTDAELLTIKIPLNLPYQTSQANFERVSGEIKVGGKIYKYVQRKVSNGELVLQCLPDYEKMNLQSARNDFFKYTNDLIQNHNSNKSGHSKTVAFKKIMLDFYSIEDKTLTSTAEFYCKHNSASIDINLPSSPRNLPDQPPELI
jgi:hypothetical protein